MSLLHVILFALVAGLYTGAVMLVPILEGTSFRDIGITYECWVVMAVIVVVNCRNCIEAALKCFLFFLISQPLCFITQVIFGHMPVEMAIYYTKLWSIPILLTLPGGFIAYFSKKQNALGAIILGIGNAIELLLGAFYIFTAAKSLMSHKLPYHLLSGLFCLTSIIVMTLCIQKRKSGRIIAFITPVILSIIAFIALRAMGRI